MGPALLIETEERSEEEKAKAAERKAFEGSIDKDKTIAALKSFIDRVVVGMEACPYTKSVDISAVGLESRGISPGPVGYRFSSSMDACQVMSAFWNCICELMGEDETKLSSIMLSLPGIGAGKSREAHNRFAAVVELVGRYLCLFRGDGAFGLVHFHPAYDRSIIHPLDKPSYGHLPPVSWRKFYENSWIIIIFAAFHICILTFHSFAFESHVKFVPSSRWEDKKQRRKNCPMRNWHSPITNAVRLILPLTFSACRKSMRLPGQKVL